MKRGLSWKKVSLFISLRISRTERFMSALRMTWRAGPLNIAKAFIAVLRSGISSTILFIMKRIQPFLKLLLVKRHSKNGGGNGRLIGLRRSIQLGKIYMRNCHKKINGMPAFAGMTIFFMLLANKKRHFCAGGAHLFFCQGSWRLFLSGFSAFLSSLPRRRESHLFLPQWRPAHA